MDGADLHRKACSIRRGIGLVLCLGACLIGTAYTTEPTGYIQGAVFGARTVVLVVPERTQETTLRVNHLLKERMESRSAITVRVMADLKSPADLRILLGRPDTDTMVSQEADRLSVTLPGRGGPAPEGYSARTVQFAGGPGILAIGADDRGVLYAAGEILRRIDYDSSSISVQPFAVSTAPAYRFRGSSANQGGTMMRLTGARGWTQDELYGVILDYALAGANCFYTSDRPSPHCDFIKSFGLMTVTGARPNQLNQDFPKEWAAGGRESWEGKNWVCPSIPEARAALLAQWEADFSARADHEVMRFFAGDPGGCDDDRCAPWGKTFVHLCEEMAAIWHKHHPGSIVLIANQDLDNEGDQYIFDYLNAAPRPWLYGLAYGPGSNAMSPYFRDELREDLFAYPRSGPVNRYLAETLHQLPAGQSLVHYSDITHWISAQYEVEHRDINIMRAYGRRTFHARPKALYRIFQAIMPFSEGDIIYSEGYHDEFHQYLWNRLLWEPNRALDDVMREYCEYHFGKEAAIYMVPALYQLEENLERPVAHNEGIGRYYDLVKEAGKHIPVHRLRADHRWRMHMQKAALDKHLQTKLRFELAIEERVRETLENGLKSRKWDEAIQRAQKILAEPIESMELHALREEARIAGEESERLFGVREVGYIKIDHSPRDLPVLSRRLESALAAKDREAKRKEIEGVLELTRQTPRPGNIFW